MPTVTDRPAASILPRFDPAEVANWIPESPGTMHCSECQHHADALVMTPSLVPDSVFCCACATRADPIPPVTPYSDPFWLLTPEEITRAETQLQRLYVERQRLERTLPPGDWGHNEAPIMHQIDIVNREALLLAMLRNASRAHHQREASQ